ncbi:uncharacterized protein L201_001472 [Kwoniella dendrophila CBS 6074]|uniref:Uncharacterized protein n=1 Tax=Kwoniella dendrophila CBS 6074 TaxID=1295534 RepID=A0AAX4JPX2_9TREE
MIKWGHDSSSKLALMKTCRRLYHMCGPMLYEKITFNEENCNRIFYGLGPNFGGSDIPSKIPKKEDDKTPFARKFNLIQSIRALRIDDIKCIPVINDAIEDCLNGNQDDPESDMFGLLNCPFTLSFGYEAIYELERYPSKWYNEFDDLCEMIFASYTCYHTGPYEVRLGATLDLYQSLSQHDNPYTVFTMHVYDLNCIDLHELKAKTIMIFFTIREELTEDDEDGDYAEYQVMTIKSFISRHFNTTEPSYIGLDPTIQKIEFHNVIYYDNLETDQRQKRITDWLITRESENSIRQQDSKRTVISKCQLQYQKEADVEARYEISDLPPFVIDLFEDSNRKDLEAASEKLVFSIKT